MQLTGSFTVSSFSDIFLIDASTVATIEAGLKNIAGIPHKMPLTRSAEDKMDGCCSSIMQMIPI